MPKAKSHLYVPANNKKMVASASRLQPGSVILDLEDGVAENQKQAALEELQGSIATLSHPDTWVRINTGERGDAEISALSKIEGLKGIWIAKAEPSKQFNQLVEFAIGHDLQLGVLIESALGYLGRRELMSPSEVTRVQIGEYDLRGELGMAAPGPEVDVDLNGVRLEVVIAARANGLSDLVSGVSSNFTDLEQFERSCQAMMHLGFTSRACIHPAQLKISDSVFSPSLEQAMWARRIVSEFEEQANSGNGAYRDENGQMADAATVRRARQVLKLLS